MSSPMNPAGISTPGVVFVAASAAKRSATTWSTGRRMSTFFARAAASVLRTVSTCSLSKREAPIACPSAERNVYAIAPPTSTD